MCDGERYRRLALVCLPIAMLVVGCSTTQLQETSSTRAATAPTAAAADPPGNRPTHKSQATDATAPPATREPAAKSGTALAALAGVAVKGRAPMTGYDRDLFGQAWSDDTATPFGHNGCDTRNDILRRDLENPVVSAGTNGCLVLSGLLHDPYTGKPIHFLRGEATSSQVQIDHVVALGDAWQTGAQQWTDDKRQEFANDPLNLLAVDGPTNQSKGAGDAATWLPPSRAFRCSYVARQTAVKDKYGLWMTAAERAATRLTLAGCPTTRLPKEPGRIHPQSSYRIATPAPPPSSPPPTHQTTTTPSGSCEPGYTPCLPIVYDLDCADISDSLKPIYVTGSDPYRLDADHDGRGCEI